MKKNSNVAEHEINSILHSKKVDDELRGIKRPDLGRHISDDVDSEMVDTLIESVSDKFNISKRYYELKAKLMGIDKLKYHERNVPYGEIDKTYSYEDSTNLVLEVFKKLDQKFFEIYKGFVENGYHHEIYLNDARRTAPEKLKTVLRQPVRKA